MNIENEKIGILIYVCTLLSFAAMEALAKFLSESFSISQIVWARYTFHFVIVLATVLLINLFGFKSGIKFPKLILVQVLRSIALLLMTYCFFTSLSILTLAEATIILFFSPLITIMLSPILLREKVPNSSWLAVIIGFIGVIIVINPNNIMNVSNIDFHWFAGIVYGIAGALFYSLYQIGTRVLAPVEPPLTSLLFSGLAGLVGTTILVLIDYDPSSGLKAWQSPNTNEWLLLVFVGLLGTIGQFLILGAYAKAKAVTLAPISYTHIIWATAFGYLLFSSIPNLQSFIGAILIVSSGIYVFKKTN
jgi:drug/metabolite transporter (DMT)-like permease